MASMRWVKTYIQQRRLRRRNYALERYPTLAIDEERFGEPIGYWPMPRWRKWKVEVWWFFDETSRVSGEGCIIQYIYWMDSLAELSAIHRTMFTTGGLYSRLRLELSTWTWDDNEPVWQEEVHV